MDPVSHIRRPDLPWRQLDLTECGRRVDDYASDRVLTFDEAQQLANELGKQRFAMLTCMTCINRASRGESVLDVLNRFANRREGREVVDRDLEAIALLVDAHRDQFDELVTQLASTSRLRRTS